MTDERGSTTTAEQEDISEPEDIFEHEDIFEPTVRPGGPDEGGSGGSDAPPVLRATDLTGVHVLKHDNLFMAAI